nr:hypothetical protein [Tanacetum cinerariifolium]
KGGRGFHDESENDDRVPTPSSDPLPSGEDSSILNELMVFCTSLQEQVLNLQEAKATQAKEIIALKKKVSKLNKWRKSRSKGLKRLKKIGSGRRVKSPMEKDGLGAQEDASKQRRMIKEINQNAEITLDDETQGRTNDDEMFRVNDLVGEEVVMETTTGVKDSVALTTYVTEYGVTMSQSLAALKSTKPKVVVQEQKISTTIPAATIIVTTVVLTPRAKGIIFHEQNQSQIPTVSSSKDKGKAKMIEPDDPIKKKDQMRIDEKYARKLEVEEQEAARISRAQQVEEANNSWDNMQAMMDANRLLAERLQAREKEEFSKGRSFDEIKELFDKEITKVNDFIAMDSEAQESSTKRTAEHLESNISKKQKNINREDLEVMWAIVKDIFKKEKLVDDMDNILFRTLKTMFEHHVEDTIWKYQQGLAKVKNWNLFESCGVYCITMQTTIYYLLVEKVYPLTRNTLHQLWNDVRLQVNYDVKMAYDLLRFIKKQLMEELIDTSMRAILKGEVNSQLPQTLLQAVSDFTTLVIEKNVTESLEAAVLARSSSQPKSTYETTETKIKTLPLDQTEGRKKGSQARKMSHPEIQGQRKRSLQAPLKTPPTLNISFLESLPMQRSQVIQLMTQKGNGIKSSTRTWINQVAHAKEPRTSFDELMDTSFDFSAFVLNRLNVKDLTQEILVGLAFELLKGSKPLSLIQNHRGRQVIPQDFFINNDMEYLKGGDSSRRLTIIKKSDYGHLEEIEVHQEDHKLYTFREALRMFTRRIVIQRRVEDLQLGVKSYQKKLNLTKPDTFRSDLRRRTTYTAYSDPQRVIYIDQLNRNRLMRTDELHKFSDGTLDFVRTALHDIIFRIRMEYLPKKNCSRLDKQRARVMIQNIDKQLFQRRLMRNLDKLVSGREYENDLRLLERTI